VAPPPSEVMTGASFTFSMVMVMVWVSVPPTSSVTVTVTSYTLSPFESAGVSMSGAVLKVSAPVSGSILNCDESVPPLML